MTKARSPPGARRRAVLAFALAGALGLEPGASGAAPPPGSPGSTVESRIAEARARRLGETEAWRRLLHAHPTPANGWDAEPDGPGFYLSPRGKFDTVAELEATLRALHAPSSRGDLHALCMFPARARFLREQLGLGPLPRPSCEARDAYYESLRPRRIHFVFSSYYLENPASAFGHVLLRIERDDDRKLRPGAPRHALVDLGVDYSADVGREGALSYAAKGLLGLFPGTFKAMPYAAKVREYADFEQRDLWEYELALTAEERRRLLEHLWELGGTYFDYFYLTENCAYHILGALDVARPEARLLSRLGSPVLPTDALRAVWESPGLVARVRFRPSLRTQLEARARGLSPYELRLVARLAEEVDASWLVGLSADRRAAILDAALDLVDLRHGELLLSDQDSPARRRKHELLSLRASVPLASPELDLPAPPERAPHLGHGGARTGAATGYASRDGAFVAARHRLALHDLLDPRRGFPALSSIEMMELELRAYPRGGRVELERLTLVHAAALHPRSLLSRSLSYRFFAGAGRPRDDGCLGCFAWMLQGGLGLALAPHQGVVLYARTDLGLAAGPELRGAGGAPARAELGPAAGLHLTLADGFALLGETRLSWLPGASPSILAELSAEGRFALAQDVALGFFVRRQLRAADLGLSAFFYF